MEMSSSSTSCSLSEDLLYLVPEKMLFLKRVKNKDGHYEVDLRRENAFTSFMVISNFIVIIRVSKLYQVQVIKNNKEVSKNFKIPKKAMKKITKAKIIGKKTS